MELFAQPAPGATEQAKANPCYIAAFEKHDRDQNGAIDISELNSAMQEFQQTVERGLPQRPFNQTTLILLAGRFAPEGGGIKREQFCRMAEYLYCLKDTFCKIDGSQNGSISIFKLCEALQSESVKVAVFPGGGEAIVRAYDQDRNGAITFDEFVQMRLAWDYYLAAWDSNVQPGAQWITDVELVKVLEFIKNRVDFDAPVHNPYWSPLRCTAKKLIGAFGEGSILQPATQLNREQFCRMMEWLKLQRQKFIAADVNSSGKIDLDEFIALASVPLPTAHLKEMFRGYDVDRSGTIEFNEFLEMMLDPALFR